VALTELGWDPQTLLLLILFGKPVGFKGVMLHKDKKFNVVDTQNGYAENLLKNWPRNVQIIKYLILFDNSGWGFYL